MKISDIMLSAMLHAGLVAGVMCGFLHQQDILEENIEIEPIFFEIIEESEISVSSQSKVNESAVVESQKEVPDVENMVRTEFSKVNDDTSEMLPIDENKSKIADNIKETED